MIALVLSRRSFLKALLSFDVLENIRAEQESIINAMEVRLDVNRQATYPPSAWRLSEIDLGYNSEHGPIYKIRYSLRLCFGLSAHVVFDSGKATIVGA